VRGGGERAVLHAIEGSLTFLHFMGISFVMQINSCVHACYANKLLSNKLK